MSLDNPTACEAARAALAAAQQGRFWDMHDALFALDQADTPEPVLFAAARRIGLDMTRFATDYAAPARLETIRHHIQEALAHVVNSTPVLFLNGRRYRGPIEPSAFRAALQAAAANRPSWVSQAAMGNQRHGSKALVLPRPALARISHKGTKK